MKRIYFLVPDLKATESISKELEHTGIVHEHIHAVGPSAKVEKSNVKKASVLQTTTIIGGLKKGLLAGFVVALALFLLLYWLLPDHINFTWLGVGSIIFIVLLFGLWSGGIIGLTEKDPVVEENENFVSSGHYILIVDMPEDREEELVKKIVRHHPGTQIAPESFTVGKI